MALTREQRIARQSGIGSSDVAALLGVDLYGRTIHDVYVDKVGMVDDVPDDPTVPMRIGNYLEPLCLELAAEATGTTVVPGRAWKNPEIPLLGSSTDGEILLPTGKIDRVVECKAVLSPRHAALWGEDGDHVPEAFIVQVQTQLIVTSTRKAYVSAIVMGEHRLFTVEWNDDLAGIIVEAAQGFWKNHVEKRTPPQVDGSDNAARMVRGLFGTRQTGVLLTASAEIEDAAQRYRQAHAALKVLEQQKETAKQEMLLAIGEGAGFEGAGWRAKRIVIAEAEVPAFTRRSYAKLDVRDVKK